MGDRLRGELAILLACVLFSGMAIAVKFASAEAGGLFISLVRFAAGAVLCLLFLRWSADGIRFHDRRSLVLRGLFGSLSMVLYFLAIQLAGNGRAALLSNTTPLFVAAFGFLFFRERIEARNLLGLGLGTAGVATVFWDAAGASLLGNLAGLASGITGGMVVHYIKRAREKNDALVVYLAACALGLPLALPSAGEAWAVPGAAWLAIGAVALLAFGGQFLLSWGYRWTTATSGSITNLAETPLVIICSVALGFEVFTPRMAVGGALIVLAVLVNQGIDLYRSREARDAVP